MSAQPSTPGPAHELTPEDPAATPAVEALIDRAFGPGRFVKVSERVREFAEFAPELSACAFDEGRLVGCARMWRVAVGGAPVMFLGPFAVEADVRKGGVGARLIERACEAAEAAGETSVLLVGDLAYFSRLGFERALDVVLPGPVDPLRVLVRRLAPTDIAGAVTPRRKPGD